MINIIPKPCLIKEMSGTVEIGAIAANPFGNATALLKKVFEPGKNGVPVSLVQSEQINNVSGGGYKLKITQDGIVITAATDQGAIYAVQTMVQIADGNHMPCIYIEDKPQYEWRGFSLDSARHFWDIDFVKNILNVMSNLKLNVLHWHLTDDQGWRIEIKKYPILTQKGSIRKGTRHTLNAKHDGVEYGRGLYYTQEQVKEIINYATSLGIDVVPEIDMPGHLVAAISCFPELSCEGKPIDVSTEWGVLDTIGCCGSDELYEFIKDILDEITELFPSKYFHIGGDEAPKTKWKSCPKCQAKIKELGLKNEDDLQGYFTNFVMDYIDKKGKSLIGWNEILDSASLNKNTIIQWWTPVHGKQLALNWLESGGKAILSRHNDMYMDHSFVIRPLRKQYNFTYAKLGITNNKNVLGIEAPQWCEYIRDKGKFMFCTYPRMMALSECAWTHDSVRDYSEFVTRLESMREYFQSKFSIELADRFSYEGKRLRFNFFLREARGWAKWHINPYHEYNEAKGIKE